jgi:hypothetical protein
MTMIDQERTVTVNRMPAARVAAILEVVDHEDPLPQYFMEGVRLGPVSIGRAGAFRLEHPSVLPVHGYMSFDGNVVYICSNDHRYPILVNGKPVRAGCWTPLPAHCVIQIGAVVARLHRHSMISVTPTTAPSTRPASERSAVTRIVRTSSTAVRATPASFDPELTRFDLPPSSPVLRAKEPSFGEEDDEEVTRFDLPARPPTVRAQESSQAKKWIQATKSTFDPELTRCDLVVSTVPIRPTESSARVRTDAHSTGAVALDRTFEPAAPPKQNHAKRLATTIAASILLVCLLAAGGLVWTKRQVASRAAVAAKTAAPEPAQTEAPATTAAAEQDEEPLGTVVLAAPPMTDRATNTPSQERAAADALRRGDRDAALALYAKLAKDHPSHPAFARITHLRD